MLTASQLAAVQHVMRLFVDEDLDHGVTPHQRRYCHGCQRARPLAGSLAYAHYQLCNTCATEYEVACIRGAVETIGQYVRDKQFGEEDPHTLTMLQFEESA